MCPGLSADMSKAVHKHVLSCPQTKQEGTRTRGQGQESRRVQDLCPGLSVDMSKAIYCYIPWGYFLANPSLKTTN